jgi:hypothetical protein
MSSFNELIEWLDHWKETHGVDYEDYHIYALQTCYYLQEKYGHENIDIKFDEETGLGAIYYKPKEHIEYISLEAIITPAGVEFKEKEENDEPRTT